VRIGEVHHGPGLRLDGALVQAAVVIGVVAVEVDPVGVVAPGAGHGVVAAVIGPVRIGVRPDVEFHRVHDIGQAGICPILAEEGVDQAQHQHPAGGFIAVHGAGEQHFRFFFLSGDVIRDLGDQDGAAVCRRAHVDDLAKPGIVAGKAVHRAHIGVVGGVGIPRLHFVHAAARLVRIKAGRIGEDLGVVAQFSEFRPFTVVGVSIDPVAFDVVDGDDPGQVLQFALVQQFKAEVILVPLPCHEGQGE